MPNNHIGTEDAQPSSQIERSACASSKSIFEAPGAPIVPSAGYCCLSRSANPNVLRHESCLLCDRRKIRSTGSSWPQYCTLSITMTQRPPALRTRASSKITKLQLVEIILDWIGDSWIAGRPSYRTAGTRLPRAALSHAKKLN